MDPKDYTHLSLTSSQATEKPAGELPTPPAGPLSAGPLTLAGSGGNPGRPTLDAGGAKMAEVPPSPDRLVACSCAESRGAANFISGAA